MKKLISKDYLHKIKLLEKYNGTKARLWAVTDQDYDSLKKNIINLENKYKYLNSTISPSRTVGFKPSKNFQKVKHRVPMLSLGNAFNEDRFKKL